MDQEKKNNLRLVSKISRLRYVARFIYLFVSATNNDQLNFVARSFDSSLYLVLWLFACEFLEIVGEKKDPK